MGGLLRQLLRITSSHYCIKRGSMSQGSIEAKAWLSSYVALGNLLLANDSLNLITSWTYLSTICKDTNLQCVSSGSYIGRLTSIIFGNESSVTLSSRWRIIITCSKYLHPLRIVSECLLVDVSCSF